tara:strand:- start:6964 stop:7503 length:540 start_codon:yes stop_codon:yes gene_type:complete
MKLNLDFGKNLFSRKNSSGLVFLLFVAFAIFALANYSNNKGLFSEGVVESDESDKRVNISSSVSGLDTTRSAYAPVSGGNSGVVPPACSKTSNLENPADLLPKGGNNEFSNVQGGNLQNVNLLKAGHHIGIDTVGQTLRNANLQLRSEYANPRVNVGPWNNSTIEADTQRKSLEIGCNC